MTAPVREGDLLDGKYRIDRVLGQGGMGVVVAATHEGLGRKVAIKFLLAEAVEHPEIIERFEREARAAATVRGPHVVQVLDVGRMADDRAYMVMEYLDGEDLEQLLERVGTLSIEDTVSYLLQACEALAEAHAAGVVHRDLKPANLFLAKQPDKRSIIKVLDFGISKMSDDGKAITKTATAMGTPFYMSPEQLMNAKGVDARADIWALGVILFELLTGHRPFAGETMPEVVAKILGNVRPLLREHRTDVPDVLDAVVNKCLRNAREDRFHSVADLAEALAPIASESGRASMGRIARVLGQSIESVRPASMPTSLSPPTAINLRGVALVDSASRVASGVSGNTVALAATRPGANELQPRSGDVQRPPESMIQAPAVATGGHPMLATSQVAVELTAKPSRERGKTGLVIASLLGVALVGGGVMFVLRGADTGKSNGVNSGSVSGSVSERAKETVAVAPSLPASASVPTNSMASSDSSGAPPITVAKSAEPTARASAASALHKSGAYPTAKPTAKATAAAAPSAPTGLVPAIPIQ
jgi:serine/threonine protein kinase